MFISVDTALGSQAQDDGDSLKFQLGYHSFGTKDSVFESQGKTVPETLEIKSAQGTQQQRRMWNVMTGKCGIQ